MANSKPLQAPLVPTKVGTQGGFRLLFGLEASGPNKAGRHSWIPTFVGMSGALLALLVGTFALAQPRAAPKRFTIEDLRAAESARDAALARLNALEEKSAAAARALSEIDADLIAAGADATAREEAAYAAEEQLMILADETQAATLALTADQAALEDLLAALMAFGGRRPPALAASPEDAGTAIRSAILMTDAAPALVERGDELRLRIFDFNALAEETRAEQANYEFATGALGARRTEIAALAEEKRIASAALDAEADAARRAANALAAEAATLKDLLDGLAKTAPPAPSLKPQPSAKPAAKPPAKPPATSTPKPSAAPAPAPAAPSTSAAGTPVPPAIGTRLRTFGQTINGLKQEGLTLSTRPAATVVAPLDARVQYSGPFRTYGLMVILDVGGDVLVVISGMEGLYPEAGQWVLAGEPIGRMADRKSPSPELYLEVRRKGQPVDPEKWLVAKR
jgi:septal ring factor EnvC (AmiA/AmiB activator)